MGKPNILSNGKAGARSKHLLYLSLFVHLKIEKSRFIKSMMYIYKLFKFKVRLIEYSNLRNFLICFCIIIH